MCVVSTKTSLSPLFKAVEEINREHGSLVELTGVFYTHELDENPGLLEELRRAIRSSDVVLIDIRTPTSRFVKALEEELQGYEGLVVPLVGGSASILKLLRLGRLRGDRIPSREYDFDTQHLDMKGVWRIQRFFEKAGKLVPLGSLRDARNWILLSRYWCYGDEWNLRNMLLLLLREYFGARVSYQEPTLRLKPGWVYHPEHGVVEPSRYKRMLARDKPIVAIFMYSGMHYNQCKPVADELARLLEAKGVQVIPVLGGASEDLDRNPELLRNALEGLRIDALVNLQWFRIRGGPYGGDPEPTLKLLRELDCPLFNGAVMFMREVEKWKQDSRGFSPIEVVTAVALPEADGAFEPIPLGGLTSDHHKEVVPIRDRVEKRVERLLRWIELRRKPNHEKRVAIVIYNYPPGEYNLGSASYLDVFKSLEEILKALKREGYNVEALSAEELRKLFLEKGLLNSPEYRVQRCGIKVPLNEYLEFFNKLPKEIRKEVVRAWGQPPGTINTDESGLLVPGVLLGNVFIGVQPSRGVHENPEKVYHSKDLPPHHQYLAFYYWIERVFKADAVIHLGTHGTLEFMPGKEVGLSSTCYPDILIGSVPHIYVYHVTNPSEMTIAKRRSYALTITHLTPPYSTAGLYEDYLELEELVHEYHEARVQDPKRARIVEQLALEKAHELGLEAGSVEEIHEKLYEMKRAVIPMGLHVLGRRWSKSELTDYLVLLLRRDGDVKSLHSLLAEARGLDYDYLLDHPAVTVNGKPASRILEELEEEARKFIEAVLDGRADKAVSRLPRRLRGEALEIARYIESIARRASECDELGALLHALRGGYLEPRVAGDPLRTPESLPTGSHGYAFDPRLIPSKAAYIRGARIAEETLRRHFERHGRYPETVAVVLWGFETMGTRGETIGQILQYLGVRLVRKHGPWSWDLEVIPLEELGRPRIDVVVTICGIFRDTFPNLISLLDRAFKLVASLDEPPEKNYVRKHALELQKLGLSEDLASARIYGPKTGAYNTRLTEIIESSNWSSEEELAETYVEDMMYAYTEQEHARPAGHAFRKLLGTVDMVTQVRYANEYEITDLDHYYEFLGGLRKAVEKIRGSRVDALWIDTTTEKPKVKDVGEAIDHAVRTRLLNPKWINAMLSHGYDGAREIAKRVEYVLGLAATTGEVKEWVWRGILEKYVLNEEVRKRMLEVNPYALAEVARRLYEAYRRGYWRANRDELSLVEEAIAEAEAIAEE